MDHKVSVVIPAAGKGERMFQKDPKQFAPIHGKPLICYAVEAFLRVDWIRDIVIACPSDSLHRMQSCVDELNPAKSKICYVTGGTSRHRSISSGLDYLKSDPPDVVVVHDGVRPIVPKEVLKDVVQEAAIHGAAGPVVPLVSTVLKMDGQGFLEESLDRTKYVASEMPQAFKYSNLLKAYANCSTYDMDHGTECLALVLKYCGVKAKLVAGTQDLWKVTHPKDLYTAAAILSQEDTVE